tara:strand:+ start:220 stop:468 length:249 start_codon:yes stop_codon:yes gene_type:complete
MTKHEFKPDILQRLQNLTTKELTAIGELLPEPCTYQNISKAIRTQSRLLLTLDYLKAIGIVLNELRSDLTHEVTITKPFEIE